eukprot:scaffold652190_cov43-Prasinocladus_malaysianus.AAC.1
MNATVNLDRNAPSRPPPSASKGSGRPPAGFSLSRSSAVPRMQTIHSVAEDTQLEVHEEHPEERRSREAPAGFNLSRGSL